MSRRRGARLHMPSAFEVVLFVAVLALGVALYDSAGAGPVVLAVIVTGLLVAFSGSRSRSRRPAPRRRSRTR